MLKGKEFGKAIDLAIKAKLESGAVKSKAQIARDFGMEPPSLVDWVKKGSVSKDKLPKLWKYFSDVAGPSHWGMDESEWPAGLTNEISGIAEKKPPIYEVKTGSTAIDPLTEIERDLIAGFHAAPIDVQAFWINQARFTSKTSVLSYRAARSNSPNSSALDQGRYINMTMRFYILPLTLMAALSCPSMAADLSCHVDESTRKHTCIDEKSIRMNGNIRSAQVYSGGPNGLQKTGFLMIVDCARNIATLQDSSGVNFAGASASETPASRNLSRWVCEATRPKRDQRIKQFS